VSNNEGDGSNNDCGGDEGGKRQEGEGSKAMEMVTRLASKQWQWRQRGQ
jgi:hypothetical protein